MIVRARRLVVAILIVLAAAATDARAQVAPGAIFRVFLRNGEALPAYGESVQVGDRLVFTLFVSARGDRRSLQLMSLPIETVDLERTREYATSMRAAHYAATRGEADYAAMTAEVQRALAQLMSIEDATRRVTLAEEAKRRLLAWSRENYSYRARDIAELAALFDDVISELRVAAGESKFELDLRAGDAVPTYPPLLDPPTLEESIALALSASRAADIADERIAILRTALAALDDNPLAVDLRASVGRELDAELAAGEEYARLADDARRRSIAGMTAGDPEVIADVRRTVMERDRELGGRRPADIRSLMAELDGYFERAAAHRLALDHYALVRPQLLAYERRIRPVLSGFDGLEPMLRAIEELRSTAYERLEQTSERLTRLQEIAGRVKVPEDLTGVHATLVSALHMAEQASARRRLAVATTSVDVAKEASAAAAGATLLFAQARKSLVERLFPPVLEVDPSSLSPDSSNRQF